MSLSTRPSKALGLRTVYRAAKWVNRQPDRCIQEFQVRLLLPRRVDIIRKELRDGKIDFKDIRATTLAYVSTNHLASQGTGCFSYRIGGPPLVYASAYAVMLRHLYGEIQSLSVDERNEWAGYLLRHQSEDGLFRDTQIACPKAEEMDWWGWRHMTLHVLMALCALGSSVARPFQCLNRFRRTGSMTDWLSTRDWMKDASCVSNEVQNYGTMLQYARDFQGETWCQAAIDEMYDWLDYHQDISTGCWGYRNHSPIERSRAVQTGYHFWCMYFYDNRPIHHVEQIIDMCLATQNRLGGFGVQQNSSACEDIDSIDPLARLSLITDYRQAEVIAALECALPWVLANRNANDGGWVFRRVQPYNIVPHKAMWAEADESFMAYTWFRSLSLAYLAKALPNSPVAGIQWYLGQFP